VALQSGSIYSWGKPHIDKPRHNDYQEFSSPYLLLEQKQILQVECGFAHIAAVDRVGTLYTYGEGTLGCLGTGDNKKRTQFMPVTTLGKKKVVDVSCGNKFTVIIVQSQNDAMQKLRVLKRLVDYNRARGLSTSDLKFKASDYY
jgi:alpha-tubulin suppressor-like RCC1 family protein